MLPSEVLAIQHCCTYTVWSVSAFAWKDLLFTSSLSQVLFLGEQRYNDGVQRHFDLNLSGFHYVFQDHDITIAMK